MLNKLLNVLTSHLKSTSHKPATTNVQEDKVNRIALQNPYEINKYSIYKYITSTDGTKT